jgi:hypothetical protein
MTAPAFSPLPLDRQADAKLPDGPVAESLVAAAAMPPLAERKRRKRRGSLGRRMIGIAAAWIMVLLAGGGVALDRVLSREITAGFDDGIEYQLIALIRSTDIASDGRIELVQQLSEQRFFEPYSGLYWQISGTGGDPQTSRSLWDRALDVGKTHSDENIHSYDSEQFGNEPLRVVERDVVLPGSPIIWRFQVAQSRIALNEQLANVRQTIVRSFALLAVGLIILAALQTIYGLWPLRRIRSGIAGLRRGDRALLDLNLPIEVQPMVDELAALIAHNERQAEEARRHAGNLAHALKTPLTVITNAGGSPSRPCPRRRSAG